MLNESFSVVFKHRGSKGKNRFFFVRLSSSANSVSIGRSYVLKSKRRGLHTSGEWWRVADPVKIYLETTSSFLLMCRCRHWRLLLLDAFYHSIGSNILDVHVLLCSTSRHKSVPSTLENCHTYTYALKDHSRKAKENWSRLKNMTEVSSPSEYNSKESNNAGASLFNWISKERKYCFESGKSLQSLGGPLPAGTALHDGCANKKSKGFFPVSIINQGCNYFKASFWHLAKKKMDLPTS